MSKTKQKESVKEANLTEQQQDLLARTEARIEDLQRKLGNKELTDRQRTAIENQIQALENAKGFIKSKTEKKSFDDYPVAPEGTYVSEVRSVKLRNLRREDRDEAKVGLGLHPIQRIVFDEEGESTFVDLDEDEKYKYHWANFNKLVKAVQSEGASTESGISKLLRQLGVDLKDVGHLSPILMVEDELIGLRVIETVTHGEWQGEIQANSSLTRDMTTGVYKVSYRKEAVAIQKHNKPNLAAFLGIDEDEFSYNK